MLTFFTFYYFLLLFLLLVTFVCYFFLLKGVKFVTFVIFLLPVTFINYFFTGPGFCQGLYFIHCARGERVHLEFFPFFFTVKGEGGGG